MTWERLPGAPKREDQEQAAPSRSKRSSTSTGRTFPRKDADLNLTSGKPARSYRCAGRSVHLLSPMSSLLDTTKSRAAFFKTGTL